MRLWLNGALATCLFELRRSFTVQRTAVSLVLAAFPSSALGDEGLWIEGGGEENLIPEIKLPSFAPAIERLGASVVNIRTKGKESAQRMRGGGRGFPSPHGGPGGETPFEFFFKVPPEQQNRPFSSLGSGFVIHPDGYIVTNHHVVAGVDEILVTTHEGDKFEAEWVGSDPNSDIAVLNIADRRREYRRHTHQRQRLE